MYQYFIKFKILIMLIMFKNKKKIKKKYLIIDNL